MVDGGDYLRRIHGYGDMEEHMDKGNLVVEEEEVEGLHKDTVAVAGSTVVDSHNLKEGNCNLVQKSSCFQLSTWYI